jgi:hypothetical protein
MKRLEQVAGDLVDEEPNRATAFQFGFPLPIRSAQ